MSKQWIKVKPLFAWYDLWIGAYVDRDRHRLYVLPIPMLGLVIDYALLREEIWFTYGSLRCYLFGHKPKMLSGMTIDRYAGRFICDHCGLIDCDQIPARPSFNQWLRSLGHDI